jgi:cell division septum initiation protein DivIVA
MIEGEARTADTEGALLRMRELLESSGTVPFSSSPRVNRDDLLTLIDDALENLPEELKRARWLLKERNEFLAKAEREAEQIIDAARVQAERMVERDEVVRSARRHADALVEDAESRSRALQHEAEDYVDQRLAAFEVVLDRTMATVKRGREQLQVHTGSPALAEAEPDDDTDEPGFFDQDV